MYPYESAIRKQLEDHPWHNKLAVLKSVGSTNTYAKVLAAKRAPHGTVVIADHQTAGRGRMGRSFFSPKGMGLYCSVILRLPLAPDHATHLTILAAEAARRAILEVTAVDAGIKWINDLVYDGRKLCGILTETAVSSPEKMDYAVIGVGINCDQSEEDFLPEIAETAISLRQITGQPTDRAALVAALLRHLEQAFQVLISDCSDWLEAYRAHCVTLGQDVRLIQNGQSRPAHANDMDDRGALLVTLEDGTQERIFSGEVSVRGLYGYQ